VTPLNNPWLKKEQNKNYVGEEGWESRSAGGKSTINIAPARSPKTAADRTLK
jgi:hypothetical protein